MKKIIAMLLAVILTLGLVACAAQPASTEQTPADDALPFEGVELSL